MSISGAQQPTHRRIEDARLPNGGSVDAKIVPTPGGTRDGIIKLTIVAVAIEAGVDMFVGRLAEALSCDAHERGQVAVERRDIGGEYGGMKHGGHKTNAECRMQNAE